MPQSLSVYILTYNSKRRLRQVLDAVRQVADEIVIVDSGSTDGTLDILAQYPVRLLGRKLDNFRDQRIFAEESCTHNWVLALDSDEVLSDGLIAEIKQLKYRDFDGHAAAPPDGYSLRYDWYFLGKQVRNFYPVKTPQYIIRLFRKDKVSIKGSRIIHESLQLHGQRIHTISQPIKHFSCDSIDDLYGKINLYTRLSAEDMFTKGEQSSWLKIHVYPWLIWARWYFLYGSWRDGEAGIVLSRYARITIYLKYLKLRHLASSLCQQPEVS
jgi:glycosyltransferase involved in cell wall biosynthesis